MTNKLCNAFVYNPNWKSKFFGFEILTLREIWLAGGGTEIEEVKTASQYLQDWDQIDDVFYRVYALYRKDEGSAPSYPTQYYSMGDFNQIEDAKQFLEDLTGSKVWVHSY
jgi:hypothetical protein